MSSAQDLLEKVKNYDPHADLNAIKEAYNFAEKAHDGCLRKSGEPYFIHPVAAAMVLADMRMDEESIMAALLHDVVEDTDVTEEELRDKFGDGVAFLVDGVTKITKVRYEGRPDQRALASLRKMFLSTSKDLRVVVVKLVDRLHNMSTLEHVKKEKQERIALETREIYVPMARLLGIWNLMKPLDDLCFKFLQPKDYEFISKKQKDFYKNFSKFSEKIKQQLKKAATSAGVEIKISDSEKHLHHIFKSMTSKKGLFDAMSDCFAVKVVVPEELDCYKALGLIHSLGKPRKSGFRDYISMPKSNGYRALHTSVFAENGQTIEFHIRSKRMDEKANDGVAARWYFSRMQGQEDEFIYSWVAQIDKLRQIRGATEEFIQDLKDDVFEDRIFVFKENGEMINLPQGAVVVDFAYAIGSQYGDNFQKAFVNRRARNPLTVLRTRDVVRIDTAKTSSGPKLVWLERARTFHAKEAIKEWLKKNGDCVLRGEEALNDALQMFLTTDLEHEAGMFSKDQYAQIGCGEKLVKDVLKDTYGAEKLLASKSTDHGYSANVCVVSDDRRGLLNDIVRLIAKEGINIVKHLASVDTDTCLVSQELSLEVRDFDQLYRLFMDLRQVAEVNEIGVQRI